MKVVVVGAGLGGLGVALRLQGQGHDVVVLEQRDAPGGRASRLQAGGFTWDTGPSLITMPWVLEETFAAAGLDLRSEIELRRLDPMYRIRWAGEPRHFDFVDSAERLEAEVARFSTGDARQVRPFLDALRPIYEHAILGAGRRPFPTLRSFASVAPSLVKLGAVTPLYRFVARFFRHPRLREAFSFHSLFIGGDPFRVPAIYGSLVYLQVLDGGWYAAGGVFSLVEAMARPLDVRCGSRVARIERRGGRVTGVALAGGGVERADVVISNADVLRTHELLGQRPPRRRLRPTMSCLLLYLGADRVFPQLRHHTLLVGPGYREFIRRVTGANGLPRSFSTYVHAPVRSEPAMAAPGGDSLAVLLPVPNLRAPVRWEHEVEHLRNLLIADLETSFGLTGLEDAIRVERRMAPPDFERDLGAVAGNAFGVEPTLHQSAYFRAPNRVRGVRGLYHVGGGTHPGAGIPGVLLGAEITAELVAADARRRR